jgi:transketolase
MPRLAGRRDRGRFRKETFVTTTTRDLDLLCINTIRTLAMDAVQKADSGHPGTPMALAPVVYALWEEFLRFDPADPKLPSRDRFVLSCGHASMLLYSALHLYGFELGIDDLKNFRQLGSPCAGHPEYRHCPGVETTTGPLGQGCANSVGMAVARRRLAQRFNRPGHELIDWRTFVLCSDGDLMEGVSFEAASLAGHWGLDGLIWIYDQNHITIEGTTRLSMSENVAARFQALGWKTFHVPDANDLEALRAAYAAACAVAGAPVLVIVDSVIAYGAPKKANTAEAHGAPLGADEIRATKRVYGWPEDSSFLVPDDVRRHMGQARVRGGRLRETWTARFAAYEKAHPEFAAEWRAFEKGEPPAGWDADLPAFPADPKGMAGRKSSSAGLQVAAQKMWWIMGGSADLGSSNLTMLPGEESFLRDTPGGRNLHFGVREHGMASIASGMALCGLRPYVATFLQFADYCRPAHRLASMMKLPVIYVYTHDSIGLGEDGPTHQPIEHLASLRAIPGIEVIRPGDANEAIEAWRYLVPLRDRPVLLILSRQNMPTLDRSKYAPAAGARRGAYVLADADPKAAPELILMATGSEVGLMVEAYENLKAAGIKARAVSFPSWEIFERQDAAYRDSVLPRGVRARVAIEAASSFGWARWVGSEGATVTRDDFGASAPASVLFKELGFTVDNVVKVAREQLARVASRS